MLSKMFLHAVFAAAAIAVAAGVYAATALEMPPPGKVTSAPERSPAFAPEARHVDRHHRD